MTTAPRLLTERAAWHELVRHADAETRRIDLRATNRSEEFGFRHAGVLLDLSRQPLTRKTITLLAKLAEQGGFAADRAALFTENQLNPTEQRAALHTALRAPPSAAPSSVAAPIAAMHARMAELVQAVRDGGWRGATGKPISQIVHIGIGGSWLGPALVLDALADHAERGPRVHLLANIDGHELDRLLAQLDAERTLCVVASKSFTTTETLANAVTLRGWLLGRGISPAGLARHFVAISANTQRAMEFGIAQDNILPMWDWVGGRYSLWSAIGLPIALRRGMTVFDALLAGAHEMDEHFANAPLERCLPFLLAAAELWNLHFGGADSHAVLAYDHRLRALPPYLQQLEMESNGKRVSANGTALPYQTAPVLWGGEGTNGQHSYHQLLHQGTRRTHTEFVLVSRAEHDHSAHTTWLHANALAQAQALQYGESHDDVRRLVPGNQPSSLLLLDDLAPHNLGALLALYEHKTFTLARFWGVNPFDQFGVELGKRLAERVHDALIGGNNPTSSELPDPTTRALVATLRRLGRLQS